MAKVGEVVQAHEEGLNLTEEILKLTGKVEGIDKKLDMLVGADDKADKALAKAVENEHSIATLRVWVYGLFSAISLGVFVPLFVFVVEKFF
ncbi:hypothetical protein FD16_GL002213 [Paucilactobacillus suebicus DSM 5007 = KCTC 3549]|uniref:Holin n=1 Tax=Paucilactobacillus suebicus DSM 5007 = KCTC 3549 TaxID=1423807 RepID=A0A0R1VYE3_9LACO|nr:hypothetical protein FD16_GL002213 [Paucilactobacillus suebicus DSM 5007 = KCTC 3549]